MPCLENSARRAEFCKHGCRAYVFSTESIDCCKFVVLELYSTNTQHIHNKYILKSVDTQPKLNTMKEIGKQEYEMDKPTHLDALASPSDIGVKRTKTGRLRELCLKLKRPKQPDMQTLILPKHLQDKDLRLIKNFRNNTLPN